MPLSPRKAWHFPPSSGEADTKEERICSFYYLNTLLTISLAGFFAKSQIMLFLLSLFRFCLPLKNDGRSEMRFLIALNTCLSFLNEVKSLAKDTGITYSSLCTHPCPYRLAKLGTSLRMRGKPTLKKKEIIIFYISYLLYIEYFHNMLFIFISALHWAGDISRPVCFFVLPRNRRAGISLIG